MIEHQPLLQSNDNNEVVLRLERYEDIFSSFDIRPYAKRALSADFLEELKWAAADKADGKVELTLLMPTKDKNEYHETIIKERLTEHFRKHHRDLLEEKRHVTRVGSAMVAAGVACMGLATLIVTAGAEQGFFFSFLVLLLEPAAWFLLWEGMDQIIFTSREKNPELEFYRKMSNSHEHIAFKAY